MHYFTVLQSVAVHCTEGQSNVVHCTAVHCSEVQRNVVICTTGHCVEVQYDGVHCTRVQWNLRLPSQLVNLLFLDWTRSSEQGNIANLLLLFFVISNSFEFCLVKLMFVWSICNVFVCSSTTVLLPDNAHISCGNYKLM